jgi:uncharacterized protein (DUF2141 family)
MGRRKKASLEFLGKRFQGKPSVARALALAAALAVMAAFAPAAWAATLTVHVTHVSPKGGIVSLALYTAKNYDDDDHPTLSRNVRAVSPETVIHLDDVAPGRYAIKMMQDINRNGKFDTSWLGLPEEPYGFSNNARPVLSEPGFKRTSFRVSKGENRITITLSDSDVVNPPSASRTSQR